jgi:hypothetical protein
VFKYGRKNVLSFKTTKTGLLRVAMAWKQKGWEHGSKTEKNSLKIKRKIWNFIALKENLFRI